MIDCMVLLMSGLTIYIFCLGRLVKINIYLSCFFRICYYQAVKSRGDCAVSRFHLSMQHGLTIIGARRVKHVMDAVFKEVKVEKVSDKIVNQLIDLITEGRLLPGEKLPSERRLTELFGVGRSSLREALNTLETLGFIEIKKRKGNYVKNMDGAVSLNPLKKIMQADQKRIIELYEVRRSIEQSSAREAAEKRTDEDLAAMERALALSGRTPEKLTFSWDDEIAFHLAIARASHNFLRLHTLKSIFDFAREFLEPVLHGYICSEARMNTVFAQHTAIFEAIRDQDREAARQLMREHLFGTNKELSDFFEKGRERLRLP